MTAPLVDLTVHHAPENFSDRLALGFTKVLRFCADTFFAKRYGHRAIVLETVAAVPGMVGATLTHLRCLRNMCDDKGWIRTLMEEAENERMHLMTFIEVAKPTLFERFVILAVQWVFYLAFFALYLISARTARACSALSSAPIAQSITACWRAGGAMSRNASSAASRNAGSDALRKPSRKDRLSVRFRAASC